MARIRTIKPEFPQSESMGNVSREARLTFIMLWTLADDEGRLRGNSRMLASLLFPYDKDASDLIDGWLAELEKEGCILPYKNGKDSYMQLCNWLIHQKIDKPSKSKILPPTEQSRILANPREVSSEDQGSRIKDQGSEERTNDNTVVVGLPEIVSAEPENLRVASLPMREVPPISQDPAVILSVALRRQGVNCMSTHPVLQEWAAKGVSLVLLTEAVALAREQKGDAPIPPNYLVPIIAKLQNPPAGAKSGTSGQRGPAPLNEKFHFSHLDRSGDARAMEESMKRHGIVMPPPGEEIEL